MEHLQIEIDFPTQQAVEAALLLTRALGDLKQAVATADEQIKKTEQTTASFGQASNTTAEQQQKLAESSRAAGTANEENAQSTKTLSETLDQMAEETSRARASMEPYNEVLAETNLTLEQSIAETERWAAELEEESEAVQRATASKQMMVEIDADLAAAAKEAAAAEAELNQRTTAADELFAGAGTAVMGFMGAFAGLQVVNSMMRELGEQMQRIIEAREKIADAKLTFDENMLILQHNLPAMKDDPQGLQKTGQLALAFMNQTGATPEQARDELAQSQASGINVQDPAGEGFKEAAEVGKFASRMMLDPSAAGQLVKLAVDAGVKNAEQMKEFLAQMEAAFENTPITNPSEFYGAAIRAMSTQLSLGVSVPQSAAVLAAATPSSPEPSEAGTNARMFSLAANMNLEAHAEKVGEEMLKRGMIDQAQLKAAEANIRKGNQATGKRQTDGKIEAEALAEILKTMPEGTKEQMLFDMTAGMDTAQLDNFVSELASNRQFAAIIPMLSPTGRANYESAKAAISQATPGQLDQRNANFRASPVSQSQQAAVEQNAATVTGNQGVESAEAMERIAEANVASITAQGQTNTGWWSNTAKDMFGDPADPNRNNRATSNEGLKGKQLWLVIAQHFADFRASLTPDQQAKYKAQLDQMQLSIRHSGVTIQNDAESPITPQGQSALKMAEDLALQFANLKNQIQQSEISAGHGLPAGDEPGGSITPSAATTARTGFPTPSPGQSSPASAPSFAPLAAPASAAVPMPLPALPQLPIGGSADAGSIPQHQTIINNHYGNVWMGPSDTGELPGRLEGYS